VAIVAIVVILAITTTGGGDDKKVTPPNLRQAPSVHPAPTIAPTRGPADAPEVEITGCTADSAGQLSARVAIKNTNDQTLNYAIKIAFQSKDGSQQFGDHTISIRNLGPGQSTDETASVHRAAPTGGYACKVADISHTPGSGR
jgi:hypothetical protein